MEEKLKVGRKGVIVIPKKMRMEVGIAEGSEVQALLLPGGILLRPKFSKPVEGLANLIKQPKVKAVSSTKSIQDLRRRIDRELKMDASIH